MSFIKKIIEYQKKRIFLTHLFRYVFIFKKVYKVFNLLLPFIKINQNM